MRKFMHLKKWKCLVILLFATISCLAVEAQIKVTGKVVSKKTNLALQDVAIVEKGGKAGTETAIDGSFTISVRSLNSTLVFSSLGYAKFELPLKGKNKIEVSLARLKFPSSQI
jgi:iron complex outermembrane receptor protein